MNARKHKNGTFQKRETGIRMRAVKGTKFGSLPIHPAHTMTSRAIITIGLLGNGTPSHLA